MNRHAGWQPAPGQDRRDVAAVDHDSVVVVQTEPVEHRARNDGVPLRHGAALQGEWRIANGEWSKHHPPRSIRHSLFAIRHLVISSG
jgi:hypothetical protein